MCATSQRRQRKPKKPSVDNNATPAATDLVADAVAETELRRLRTLYGRRATILTPEREALGNAPAAQKNLLGS